MGAVVGGAAAPFDRRVRVVALPKDVFFVCQKEGISSADVVEWKVGARIPHKDLKGRVYWVKPVLVVTRSGKRYVFQVADLNGGN